MKLSLVRTDKKNVVHLSTFTLERFLEHIQTERKSSDVRQLREHVARGHGLRSFAPLGQLARVYPSVVWSRQTNGALKMAACSGMVALHVEGLSNPADIDAVKASAQVLPMTLAVFVGADGRSAEVLVKVSCADGTLPKDEADAEAFCKTAYERAFLTYSGVLPFPIRQTAGGLKASFLMTLDAEPFYNDKAIALKVDDKAWKIKRGVEPLVSEGLSDMTGQEDEPLSEDAGATRKLIDFLNKDHEFRYNVVMGYPEYRVKGDWMEVDWKRCDEKAENTLTIKAKMAGLEVHDKDVRRYVHSDLIRRYDPLRDYLWSLQGTWDGKDHIGQLAGTVPCDTPQWAQWFRKWFLYMVAQWLGRTRKYGNAVVPLLISRQGYNKSTFCRSLLPQHLLWGYTDNINLSEKRQVLLAMSQFMLINLDEFNQIAPKVQEGFLKNLLQLPAVKVKPLYGRHVDEFPRLASFIATTNEVNVLSDPTGNRRFIGVQLTGPIDVDYVPNYDQLYAEAVTAVLNGEQYWFTPEEESRMMEHNRQFLLTPPAVQFFLDYYDIPSDERTPGAEWLTPSAIYDDLRRHVGRDLQVNGVNRFGQYLANLPGLHQRRVSNARQYLVIRKR